MAKWGQAYKCEACGFEQMFWNEALCEECGEIGLSRGKAKIKHDEWGETNDIIQGSWKPRSEHVEGKKRGGN